MFKPTEAFVESIRTAELKFMTDRNSPIADIMKYYAEPYELCMFGNCMTDQGEIEALWKQMHGSLEEYKLYFRNMVMEDEFLSREWVAYMRNGKCDAWSSGYSLFLFNEQGLVSRQMEWSDDTTNGWEVVYDEECFQNDTKTEL